MRSSQVFAFPCMYPAFYQTVLIPKSGVPLCKSSGGLVFTSQDCRACIGPTRLDWQHGDRNMTVGLPLCREHSVSRSISKKRHRHHASLFSDPCHCYIAPRSWNERHTETGSRTAATTSPIPGGCAVRLPDCDVD